LSFNQTEELLREKINKVKKWKSIKIYLIGLVTKIVF
jgi:hypothetical protein